MKVLRLIALGACFISTLSLQAACASGGNNNKDKEEQTKSDSPIKHIDAAFMRQNIWDYKENPNKFVFRGQRPVILDFYASWCGPCRRLAPKLEQVAKKYAGKIDVYKINVDDQPELSRVFSVRSIPMVLFVPTKATPIQTLGDLSLEQIEETIKQMNEQSK